MIDPVAYLKFMAYNFIKEVIYRLWWVVLTILFFFELNQWVSSTVLLLSVLPLAYHVGHFVWADESMTLKPEKSHAYRVWWTIYTSIIWWGVIPYVALQETHVHVRGELALCVPLVIYGTLFSLTLRGVQHHAAHKVKEWWPEGAPAIVRLHAQAHCGGHHRDAYASQYWIVPIPALLYFLTFELVTWAWWTSVLMLQYGWLGVAWCLALMLGTLNGAIMFELGHGAAHMGYWTLEQGFNTVWHNTHHRVGGFYAIFPSVDWPNVFFEKHIKGFIDFQVRWMPAWWKRWCEPKKNPT